METMVRVTRRDFNMGLTAALGTAATGLASSSALAQAYPNQDIRFVCAFPPGSGSDVIVRYYAEKIRPLAGRTIVVDNRPGAGGNLATEFVSRAKPDGYTIYVHTGSSVSANMHTFKKPPVDAGKALQVAATINKQAFMIVVHPDSPHKTLQDLTQALKAKGDKASYASSATSGKVLAELYKSIAGLQAVEVNYRMAQDSLNDLATGAADFGSHDPQFALAQADQGRLRILAVATADRLQSQPQLPTMAEGGVPGIDLVGWFAAMVPAGTPGPIVTQIAGWFNQVTGSAEGKEFLNKFGGDPYISTPEEGQARLLKDIQAWGDYIRIARIEPQG
jgi:tripartite-type tricarboxylate transporter receptor subunit TctC